MVKKNSNEIDSKSDLADLVDKLGLPASDAFPSVLVLDDDHAVGETVVAMINSIGAVARVSHTADEFFTEWKRSAPDVAIIDLQMPDRDGLDVIRQLGALGDAQIIVSSGCDARILQSARHAARNNGLSVVGILPKPMRRSALKELLGAVKSRHNPQDAGNLLTTSDVIDAVTLRTALETGQIHPFYQPKLRLHDKTIVGFEALARWEHPGLGLLLPDLFLPSISMHGLDRELTEVMLTQAVMFLSKLPGDHFTMAVNVSMEVCSEASFPSFISGVLAHYSLAPARITLEVTEAGPLEISQDQVDALMRLRMRGLCLSIDDFGTGVSSLERLVRIPFNELKIDRYFVREICTSAEAKNLVLNLVSIATSMDMTVIIEGIEDAPTLELAEKLGCEVGQGYQIARPMPGSDVPAWISDFSSRR